MQIRVAGAFNGPGDTQAIALDGSKVFMLLFFKNPNFIYCYHYWWSYSQFWLRSGIWLVAIARHAFWTWICPTGLLISMLKNSACFIWPISTWGIKDGKNFEIKIIVFEKPGILPEYFISSNYPKVQYFLLKFRTRFVITNLYKRVFGIFLILSRSWVINKNVKNEWIETTFFFDVCKQHEI